MAITKMKLVTITGPIDTLDAVTMRCLGSGSFQPETSAEALPDSGYYHINEDNPYATYLQRITGALKSSGREPAYETEISSDFINAKTGSDVSAEDKNKNAAGAGSTKSEYFNSLDIKTTGLWSAKYNQLNVEGYESGSDALLAEYDHNVRIIEDVLNGLQGEKTKLAAEFDRYKNAIEQLRHFETLNIDVGKLWSLQFLKLRFGRLPLESAQEIDSYDKSPYVEFFRCSESDKYCWGMYVAPVSEIVEIDRIFAALFFERIHIPDITGTPADAIKELSAEYDRIKQRVAELDKKINDFWDAEYESCMRVCAKLHRLSEAFNIRHAATRRKDGYLLFGWVPENEADKLADSLDEIKRVKLKIDSPKQVSWFNPPTKLKNPWFSRPYEFFVAMFGMPRYNDFDPTSLVAVTYTLFFGIMFADLGQGLLLAFIGWLMSRKTQNKLGPILVRCGISGAVFGTIFGSVFGYENWLDGFYSSLGINFLPIKVMESSSINMILISAVGIGVLLMFVAISLNIFISLRRGELGAALFSKNGLAGLILYGGMLILILKNIVTLNIPTGVVAWLMIALPCLLIWLEEPLGKLVSRERDWMPENWGEYLVQGIFELFESVLSYLTNTVSFIRVGAFVLVHAGMMLVFTTVAEMIGGGVGGVIVMIFGNILVTALEGLLVGVQSLRLEYYELFSRFFSGSGKEFTPAGTVSAKN